MAKTELNTRGFDALVGETISHVITTAINVVHIHCKSGKIVSIDAEESLYGIPVVQVGDWTGNDTE